MVRFVQNLLCIILMMISSASFAEDGLVVQFTITETPNSSNQKYTYTNAVLMKFDEEVSFDFADSYVLKIRSRTEQGNSVNLLISLKDIIDSKSYYVGADAVTVAVGEKANIEFTRYDTAYEVLIDTSYGTIPRSQADE